MKKLSIMLISIVLLCGCAKVKFQKRLYEDFEEFNRTLQNLPKNFQIENAKTIAQVENAAYGVVDKAKSAGSQIAVDVRKEIEKGFTVAIENAGREFSELIELTGDMASVRTEETDKLVEKRIYQVGDIAKTSIKDITTFGNESLNRSNKILLGAISKADTTFQNAIELIDISVGDKIVLANDLAKKDAKAFMARLDKFVDVKAELIDKMLEQRVNQVFYRLNKSIEISSKELDKVLGKNIDRFYYRGDVVAKDLLDAARKSTTMLVILVIKGIIVVLSFLFVFKLILGVVKENINITARSVVATSLFILLSASMFFTDIIEKMIGEKYIKIEDVCTTTERNFKKVEGIFNSTDPIDVWTTIRTCTKTINGLEMCKVLSAPDNDQLQAFYENRIEDVYWLLSKSLPEKYSNYN